MKRKSKKQRYHQLARQFVLVSSVFFIPNMTNQIGITQHAPLWLLTMLWLLVVVVTLILLWLGRS